MPNLYQELRQLLAPDLVQIGEVVAYEDGVATISLPGAGQIRARGAATVGSKVFVQGEVIQGPAPDLPIVVDVI